MANPASERILVTGGTGFIGRYIVDLLIADGFCPLVVTRSNETSRDRPNYKVVEVDLADTSKTKDLIGSYKPQIVFHLAGVTPGHPDPTGRIYHDVNFTGTINLLRALNNTDVHRVVMLGSAAEYGDQPTPFREDMPAQPMSQYASSKAEANQCALEMHAATGFPVTILRVFTAFGYGQPHKMFLSQVITHALLKRHFKMSDGFQKRDFVHVEDVTAAIRASIAAENAIGRIINIGSGKGIALRDLATHVWRICGADIELLDIGSRTTVDEEAFDTEADISLAKELLKWNPGPAILSESRASPALIETIRKMRSAAASARK